ncbi:HPP family protein [Stygiolobus azoricus]|uniref:HPP family protein n=1 Tax=Stygiolobus azoricus TaxID=41675 RepID=A0A650CQI5_9CREN|nr:HPP family protein [Stygiolobus azoricus]QGR19737.1 HPP family protein [Stygiolobus azoricus]
MEVGRKYKLFAFLNLSISILVITIASVETHVSFILPPFLATAATKLPDPAWKFQRSLVVISSYLLSASVGVIFVPLGSSIFIAVLASIIAYGIELLLDIEHPLSILATFLGVLERVSPIYILHPVIVGVLTIEGINYMISRIMKVSMK